MKKILVTGNGQDAKTLAEILSRNSDNIVYLTVRRHTDKKDYRFNYFVMDLMEQNTVNEILNSFKPDEIINTAAQSHVGLSFKNPEITTKINTLGVLYLLEWIRQFSPETRMYQCSTSEMFGGDYGTAPQSESTPFKPKSPYGASKLAAHNLIAIYRQAYGLYVCSGILFNHENRYRGDNFVTKKIVNYVKEGDFSSPLQLGNVLAKRDWGYADEFCEAIISILRQPVKDAKSMKDYVVGTGTTTTVHEFCREAFRIAEYYGEWYDLDTPEKAFFMLDCGKIVVEVSKEFYRPLEVNELLADPSAIETDIGWKASKNSVQKIICDMLK